jgi:hypothetical protein
MRDAGWDRAKLAVEISELADLLRIEGLTAKVRPSKSSTSGRHGASGKGSHWRRHRGSITLYFGTNALLTWITSTS